MSIDRSRLSKQVRKDPALLVPQEDRYNRVLQTHFRVLGSGILDVFVDAGGRRMEGLIEQGFLYNDFDRGVSTVIENHRPQLPPIAHKYSEQAVLSGWQRANQWMALQGYPDITVPLDPMILETVSNRNLKAIMNVEDVMAEQIRESVSEGLKAGEGSLQIRDRIIGRVKNIGYARAELVAREETRHAYRAARDARYRAHGVERVQWLTAGDEQVCGICEPLDMQIYNAGEEPEYHVRCRCETVPVSYEGGLGTTITTPEDL